MTEIRGKSLRSFSGPEGRVRVGTEFKVGGAPEPGVLVLSLERYRQLLKVGLLGSTAEPTAAELAGLDKSGDPTRAPIVRRGVIASPERSGAARKVSLGNKTQPVEPGAPAKLAPVLSNKAEPRSERPRRRSSRGSDAAPVVAPEVPFVDPEPGPIGKAEDASSSPQDPPSDQSTSGPRKRGIRRSDGSPSTLRIAPLPGPTASTPATSSGGE